LLVAKLPSRRFTGESSASSPSARPTFGSIGQEVIARLDTYQRVQKRLVMLRFPPQAQATPGAALKRDGQTVGSVTSVARAPDSGEVVGLGYVRVAAATVGTWLELVLPGKDVQGWAEVTGLPLLFGPGGG
jgi:glycine cleavage system aminomethyltransferase T